MSKFRAVLRRQWPLLLITTVLGAITGVITAQFAPDEVDQVYTASQVVVANPNSGSKPLIPQDALKVTRGEVPVRAAALLAATEEAGSDSVEAGELASDIDTNYDADSSSLTISSNDTDADLAQARVAAFTNAFLEVTNAELQSEARGRLDRLEEDLAQARSALTEFDATYPELTLPGSVLPNDAATQQLVNDRQDLQSRIGAIEQEVRAAELNLSRVLPYESLGPERPRPATSGLVDVPASVPVRAGLLGFLGLLVGGVVAMILERLNRRVDTREELVEVTDIPILAEIGYLSSSRRHSDAEGALVLDGVWAEPYRRVRAAIQFVQATRPKTGTNGSPIGARHDSGNVGANATPPQVFLVTSTAPGEGKSTTTALTGEALAEVSQPTLVVGGDFRRPEIDRLLGVPRSPSMADMARYDVKRATVDDVVHRRDGSSLYVAPAGKGTREVSGLIEAAKEVATEGRRRGATVLIDSSPLQAANDPVDLLPVVDYVILVVRAGRTTESGLLEAIDTLRRMDAPILGIVLIGTPASGRRQSYYYDYYSPTSEDGPSGDAGADSGGPETSPQTPTSPTAETGSSEAGDTRAPAGVRRTGSVEGPGVPGPPNRRPAWTPPPSADQAQRSPGRARPQTASPPPFRPPSASS